MYIWHTTNTTDPNMINDDNGIDRTINHSNDDNPDNNHNHHRHHQQHHNRNMNSTGSQRWWLSFATFVLHFRALFCICGLCLVRGIGALLNRLLSLSNICMCPRPNLSNIHSPPSPPGPQGGSGGVPLRFLRTLRASPQAPRTAPGLTAADGPCPRIHTSSAQLRNDSAHMAQHKWANR